VARPKIFLIHWKENEAQPRMEAIQRAGYQVEHCVPNGMSFRKKIEQFAPTAIVIDLDRLPMQGRDIGAAIRGAKVTRHIPIVFVGGESEKVDRVRHLLPDAIYAEWRGIGSALKRAVANPPAKPVAPKSVLAGYSGTPLPKKLGIKEKMLVALVHAPPDFKETLGDLPGDVKFDERASDRAGLTLWFVRSRAELESQVDYMAIQAGSRPMWIIWPKKASGIVTDVAEPIVRNAGLSAGLVDYKVCAVDATWSGLLFARRSKP